MIIFIVKPAPFIKALAAFARIAGFANTDDIIVNILPSAASGQNMVCCQFIRTAAIDTNVALLTLPNSFPDATRP